MNVLRRSAVVGIASLLSFLLLSLAVVVGILQVVGKPEPIKKTLSETGVYSSVVSSALDEAKKASEGGSEVSLTNPVIKKAAEEAFTPQTIQQSSEQVIDGVYAWLNGETPEPSFNIDLTNIKTTFAKKVGQAASERAATLAVCPGNYIPVDSDPFNTTCLPRGVTAAQVGTQAEQDILRGEGFLEKPVITSENFKNEGGSGNLFNDQLKDVPERFQMIKTAPIILTVLALLMVAGIVFLSATKRKGIRKVGVILLSTGVLMLIFAWALNYFVTKKAIPDIKLENKTLQASMQKLATNVTQDMGKNYWIFGGTYTSIGVLAIGGTMFIGRGKNGKGDSSGNHKSSGGPSKDEKPEPVRANITKPPYKAPAKPPKKVVMVQ